MIRNGQIMAKVFKKLLCVQIFAVLTAMLCSIVDGIIISNFLGRASMAAFSISMPVFVVLACISNMVGNASLKRDIPLRRFLCRSGMMPWTI